MESDELLIRIKEGKLRGKRKTSSYTKLEYFSFLGIPYAEPPVGKLRFKPPVAVKPWEGVLDATEYRNECLQYSHYTNEIRGDEDCLYLNVNSPEAPCKITTPKAVIVYIHQGAFSYGSGSYFGSADFVMHHDIVYVTINYRLHIFGFLNLGTEDCRGNFGIRDMILALKWVKENISAFGGDPNNITLYGGSSGSMAVHHLMLTKQAEGLFHRAIMQSGFATSSCISLHETPIKIATEYAKFMGCRSENPQNIYKFLFRKPASELLVAQMAFEKAATMHNAGKLTIMPFMPSVELIKEDAVIAEPPNNSSFVNPVPVIYGVCEHELVFLLHEMHFMAVRNDLQTVVRKNLWHYNINGNVLRETVKRVKEKYFVAPDMHNFIIGCDQFFNTMAASELYSTFIEPLSKENSKSIYMYLFTYDGELNLEKKYFFPKVGCCSVGLLAGTCHADDSFYWIGGVSDYVPHKGTNESKVIENMGRLFTNFAKTGNPNNEANNGTYWTPYSKDKPCFMNINAALKMEEGRFFEKDLLFWDEIFEYIRDFKKKEYAKCADICTTLLMKNSLDQAVWVLKMRALSLQVMVDDIEAEEEGIADMFLDTDTIAVSARPGTSLRTSNTSAALGSTAHRPRTVSGRPVSGVVRPGTQASGGETLQQMLKTPRTAHTARPLTSKSARNLRLGTASMVSQIEGPFIQVSRLNLAKYAAQKLVSKPLFEYIYYHENDVRNAMDLAVEATKACEFKDPWWKVQLGKCYFLLGLNRDAEKQFKSALKQQPAIETYLRLARIYLRLDQPITALDLFTVALKQFPNEVTIMTEMARIFEGLNNLSMSVKSYKEILQEDATNMEAIACIGVHHFYTDQPDIALRFYRRLLQMGLYNAELFNNLGLCCFYAQQFDMVITCFERALSLAIKENAADVWYNIAHVAIGVGDVEIAEQCLRLALSIDSTHAPSFNNLGVIMFHRGHIPQACSFFDSATSLAPYLFEPHYNRAFVSYEIGDLQTSYMLVKKSLQSYPTHMSSQKLLDRLKVYFSYL